jgi:hypothetical protein
MVRSFQSKDDSVLKDGGQTSTFSKAGSEKFLKGTDSSQTNRNVKNEPLLTSQNGTYVNPHITRPGQNSASKNRKNSKANIKRDPSVNSQSMSYMNPHITRPKKILRSSIKQHLQSGGPGHLDSKKSSEAVTPSNELRPRPKDYQEFVSERKAQAMNEPTSMHTSQTLERINMNFDPSHAYLIGSDSNSKKELGIISIDHKSDGSKSARDVGQNYS